MQLLEKPTNSSNSDSSRANAVNWLDAPTFEKENSQNLEDNSVHTENDGTETLTDWPERELREKRKQDVAAAAFAGISLDAPYKSTELYGDVYTNPLSQTGDTFDSAFANDGLFSTNEYNDEITHTDNDSRKIGFDTDD